MPKSFSEHEREKIQDSMLKAGAVLLRQKGVKHVTVEDIAKAVKIANGSFYSFYKSREEFFLTIIRREEQQAVCDILAIAALDIELRLKIRKIFYEVYLKEGSVLFFLTRQDMEYITRKIPPDTLRADKENSHDIHGMILSLCHLDNSPRNKEILTTLVSSVQSACASFIPETSEARAMILEILIGAVENFCCGSRNECPDAP